MIKFTNLKKNNIQVGMSDYLDVGRYTGIPVKTVLKDNPSYLNWMKLNTEIIFSVEVEKAIIKELSLTDKYSNRSSIIKNKALMQQLQYADEVIYSYYAIDNLFDDVPF